MVAKPFDPVTPREGSSAQCMKNNPGASLCRNEGGAVTAGLTTASVSCIIHHEIWMPE